MKSISLLVPANTPELFDAPMQTIVQVTDLITNTRLSGFKPSAYKKYQEITLSLLQAQNGALYLHKQFDQAHAEIEVIENPLAYEYPIAFFANDDFLAFAHERDIDRTRLNYVFRVQEDKPTTLIHHGVNKSQGLRIISDLPVLNCYLQKTGYCHNLLIFLEQGHQVLHPMGSTYYNKSHQPSSNQVEKYTLVKTHTLDPAHYPKAFFSTKINDAKVKRIQDNIVRWERNMAS